MTVYARCSLLNLEHAWSEVNTQTFSLFLLVTPTSLSSKEIEIHPLKMTESGAIGGNDSLDKPWNAKFQPTEFFFSQHNFKSWKTDISGVSAEAALSEL